MKKFRLGKNINEHIYDQTIVFINSQDCWGFKFQPLPWEVLSFLNDFIWNELTVYILDRIHYNLNNLGEDNGKVWVGKKY